MQIKDFSDMEVTLGASRAAYPRMEEIPEEHARGRSKGCKVASSLFFNGGRLADHGLRLKDGVDADRFRRALRAMLCSFEPPHELKEAACGWLIEAHTEPTE